jgi:hypothetical protein
MEQTAFFLILAASRVTLQLRRTGAIRSAIERNERDEDLGDDRVEITRQFPWRLYGHCGRHASGRSTLNVTFVTGGRC